MLLHNNILLSDGNNYLYTMFSFFFNNLNRILCLFAIDESCGVVSAEAGGYTFTDSFFALTTVGDEVERPLFIEHAAFVVSAEISSYIGFSSSRGIDSSNSTDPTLVDLDGSATPEVDGFTSSLGFSMSEVLIGKSIFNTKCRIFVIQ